MMYVNNILEAEILIYCSNVKLREEVQNKFKEQLSTEHVEDILKEFDRRKFITADEIVEKSTISYLTKDYALNVAYQFKNEHERKGNLENALKRSVNWTMWATIVIAASSILTVYFSHTNLAASVELKKSIEQRIDTLQIGVKNLPDTVHIKNVSDDPSNVNIVNPSIKVDQKREYTDMTDVD